MFAIDVEFGKVGADGEGEAVKWAGCGKWWVGCERQRTKIFGNY
jgi:hypothetical protein